MAKIITIAPQKGGVRKSTLALNLALSFHDQLSVAIVDSDLQGSIYHIKHQFPDIEIFGPDRIGKLKDLPHDLVLVDTPPYLFNKLNDSFEH